ncbi:MAG TPA: AMP-binding protein [Bryobacteraceae bacterium]|nr:AMP-binding protein [Bryobacteraceae bacterium]
MQLESFLEQSAARFPDKTALVAFGSGGARRFTYREMEARSNCAAHALIERGVQRGDRVAIQLDNSPEAAVSIFAILKAGAVFLVIHPSTKPEKLAYILEDCGARLLITDSRREANSPGRTPVLLADADPTFQGEAFQDQASNCQRPRKQCIDIDLAALIYTSGSTGKPKGVMLTHLNMVSAAASITEYLENRPEDIIFNALPFSFDYGLYQLLMAFKIGGTLVLERGFTFPRAVLDTVQRENVTGLPLVPTMAALLLQLDWSGYNFPALRYITNTAAALPVQQIVRLRALFPHVKIYSMYGLTECKRVSYLPPDQIDIRPKSVGKGMPNEEVYIVDEFGAPLGPGIPGELVVRGSNVMKGYWNLPAETDKVLKPGKLPGERVLYTGDLFIADEEGYLYFIGRKDDIIKTRGEKVSPREVEEALYAIEGVAEAAVIGVPDSVLGEAIKAIVTLRTGAVLTEQQVQFQCSKRLEDFMVPKFVEFREGLPKSANGKIDKRELAAMAESRGVQ